MLKYGYVYETHAEAAVIESEREGIYVGITNGFIKKWVSLSTCLLTKFAADSDLQVDMLLEYVT